MTGKGPNFIGIGARKSGTTWIYHCLYEHPQIHATIKEIHFFNIERNWRKGKGWYESFFRKKHPDYKSGEFTSSYLANNKVPRRIYDLYPNVKLIVSLRDPLDRAFSHYIHDLRHNDIKKTVSFRDALEKRPAYLEQGLYYGLLKNYLRFFDSKQILILIYEDINKDPLRFIQSVYRFIGVDGSFVPSVLRQRFNDDRIPRFQRLERALAGISRRLQLFGLHRIWWLFKKYKMDSLIDLVNREADKNPDGYRLNRAEKRKIKRGFKDDIDQLERLINRQLKEWR